MKFLFRVFYDPNDPISTHMYGKRMPNSKSAHQITSGGIKTRKMTYDVIKGHWPLMTSERSQCQCKPWMWPPNTYPCPYHQHKYRSSQVSGVETIRNFAWHDLGYQVTGQRSLQVRSKNFQGRCKIVQRIGMPSFVTIGWSVRELFSENPRGLHPPWGCIPPPVPARVNISELR